MGNALTKMDNFKQLNRKEMNHIKGGGIIVVIEEDLGEEMRRTKSKYNN